MNFDFSLPNVDGRTVSLADYADQQGVAVVFTCNHCPYAVAYELRLIALHNAFAERGIPVVAISSNDAVQYPQDSFDLMKVRAEQRGFPFVYLYDESQAIAHAYGATRTPHVFLLKREGEAWHQVYAGAIDDNYQDAGRVQKKYLAEAMEAVLTGAEPALGQTDPVGCSVKWK